MSSSLSDEEWLEAVEDHFVSFFAGHEHTSMRWELGPITRTAPWFSVMEFEPGPKTNLWAYVSLGNSLVANPTDARLEFLLLAPARSLRPVELLAMNTQYHADFGLGLGDTVPIGEPWLEGSRCDHFLISLPFPLGPEFEICPTGDSHVHCFWLLPITESERAFKKENGVEALEQRFDDTGLEYWDITRAAVV